MKSTKWQKLNWMSLFPSINYTTPLLGAKPKLEMEVTRLTAQKVALEVKRWAIISCFHILFQCEFNKLPRYPYMTQEFLDTCPYMTDILRYSLRGVFRETGPTSFKAQYDSILLNCKYVIRRQFVEEKLITGMLFNLVDYHHIVTNLACWN